MDKETIQVQAEGQMIADYVKSDGYRWVKDRLMEKIMDLQSIMNVDGNPETVIVDLKARRMAVETLVSLIKQIEGRAEQHTNNAVAQVTEEFIVSY
jgi:hypothetical protein